MASNETLKDRVELLARYIKIAEAANNDDDVVTLSMMSIDNQVAMVLKGNLRKTSHETLKDRQELLVRYIKMAEAANNDADVVTLSMMSIDNQVAMMPYVYECGNCGGLKSDDVTLHETSVPFVYDKKCNRCGSVVK